MQKDCVLLITNSELRGKLPALQFRPTRVAVFFVRIAAILSLLPGVPVPY